MASHGHNRSQAYGCCADTDGCSGIDCGTGATCADVAAPGTGYTCSCDDGYTGTATTDGAATCGELIHMIV